MDIDKITIDDFVMLGNAEPDRTSDNRVTVCTAGYSKKHGLVRIYPVPSDANIHRWDISEIQLERNPQDTRNESWKIQGSKSEWNKIKSKINVHGKLKKQEQVQLLSQLYKEFGVDCVLDLNDQRRSLGFIKPTDMQHRFEKRKHRDMGIQTTLFSNKPFLTINDYDFQPRMNYRCVNCKAKQSHDQQILEWGVYEWMRKNPDNMDQVWKNLHLDESGYDITFLVGNLFRYKNSFVIISIFRPKINK